VKQAKQLAIGIENGFRKHQLLGVTSFVSLHWLFIMACHWDSLSSFQITFSLQFQISIYLNPFFTSLLLEPGGGERNLQLDIEVGDDGSTISAELQPPAELYSVMNRRSGARQS
jgi:hypothetical protein